MTRRRVIEITLGLLLAAFVVFVARDWMTRGDYPSRSGAIEEAETWMDEEGIIGLAEPYKGRSMEPRFTSKMVVVIEAVPMASVEVGDPVAYHGERGGIVGHTVIEITEQGWFRTKGEANPLPDPAYVTPANYIGRIREDQIFRFH